MQACGDCVSLMRISMGNMFVLDIHMVENLLHDLHALSGRRKHPILSLRVRDEFFQGRQTLFLGRSQLLDQIDGQIEVLRARGGHRNDVVRLNRGKHIGERPLFEELAAETRVRTEQKHGLAIWRGG